MVTNFNTVLLELFPQELPRQHTPTPAGLGVVVVESLRMRFLQQVLEPRPVGIGKANQVSEGIHTRRAGEVCVSALLAKVLLLRSSLPWHSFVKSLRQVSRSFSLMAHLAKHKLTSSISRGSQPPLRQELCLN